ncbi:MAG: hypothetical protein JWM53_6866, partial [bacterium]|nr:hypothetical protein [bacterium]
SMKRAPSRATASGSISRPTIAPRSCRTSRRSRVEPRNVAILVHQDVELLDFAGPGEVFSAAGSGIEARARTAELTMSGCNGAITAAKTGLRDGLQATTHWGAVPSRRKFPRVTVVAERRFIDDGRVLSTQGVSAGIDGALHQRGAAAFGRERQARAQVARAGCRSRQPAR